MSQAPETGQRLRCPFCSRILKVPASLAGTIRRCPHCDRKVRIPGTVAAESSDSQSRRETATAPESLPVVCDVCTTRFYALPDQLGQYVKCPDCGRANLVRPRPKSAPVWRPQLEAPELEISLEPSESDETTRVSHARELLMAAHENMNMQDQEATAEEFGTVGLGTSRSRGSEPSVRRTMIRFLGNSNVWPQWLGIAVALLPLSEAVGFIATSEGLAQVAAILLCVVLAVLGTLLLSFFATRMIDVLEMTANDTEKKWIDWPDHDIAGRFLNLMFFVNAASFSALPGGIAAQFFASPLLRATMVFVSLFLLFPIVLLSMLDQGSCMVPYSQRIWMSVEQIPGAWLRFYLRSGVMAAGMMGILWIGPLAFSWPQRALVILGGCLAAWVYVRWLGGIGLTCVESQAETKPSPQQTEVTT